MKQIEIFYLSRMNQQRAFWFFKQLHHQMEKVEDERFQPVLHSFSSAFNLFDKSLKPNGDTLKERIEAENANCNKEWSKLKELIEQTPLSNQTENIDFARVVREVIDNNADPVTVSDYEKVGLLTKIFTRIKGKASVKDSNTAIFDSLLRLNRYCWVYKRYLEIRDDELAGKFLTRQLIDARKRVELACYSVVEFLNAMFIYKGIEGYETFIDEMNHIINMGKSTPIIDIYSEDGESGKLNQALLA